MDEELAKRVLFIIADILKDLDIQFFLASGTCLGAYRDGGIIKRDDDIDLLTKAEEFVPKFPLLMKTLKETFKGCKIGGGHLPLRRTNRMSIFRHGQRWDIGSLFLIDNERWSPHVLRHRVYPAYLFDNPEQIDFLGRKFNIPTPVTEYLELNYGSDYMIPRLGKFPTELVPKKQFGNFDKSKVSEELR